MIYPKSCTNTNVGVVKEGWSVTNPSSNSKLLETHTFRTTTPRVVGLRLDLNKGELKCWLNGIFQPSKTKSIEKGVTYYPCIKIKEKGNHIILNPFATDPETALSTLYHNKAKFSLSHVKESLKHWVVIGWFTKTDRKNLATKVTNSLDFPAGKPTEYIFDDNSNVMGLKFTSQEHVQAFVEKNKEQKIDNKALIILSRDLMSEWGVKLAKDDSNIEKLDAKAPNADQINQMIPWFRKNFSNLMRAEFAATADELTLQSNLAKSVSETLTTRINSKKQPNPPEENKGEGECVRLEYNNESKNLLVIKGNMIKLLTKGLDCSEFPLHAAVFSNRPVRPKDIVTIPMSIASLAVIFCNLSLEDNITRLSVDRTELQALTDFIKATDVALAEPHKPRQCSVSPQPLQVFQAYCGYPAKDRCKYP